MTKRSFQLFSRKYKRIKLFTKHLAKDELVGVTMVKANPANVNTRNNTGIFLRTRKRMPLTFMY